MIGYSVFCQLRELAEQKHLTLPQIAEQLQRRYLGDVVFRRKWGFFSHVDHLSSC